MITLQDSRIVVSHLIRCRLNEVWQVLTDTDQWAQWGPSVSRVQCAKRYIELSSTGSIRTILGFWVPFTITEYEHLHFWKWRIGRFEATGHRLVSVDDQTCRLSFDLPWWAFPYAIVCLIALGRISSVCESGGSSE